MDKKEVIHYVEKYAPNYSKEQLTKRLLESGASYDDIEDSFHKYYNNEHHQKFDPREEKVKNSDLKETKKKKKKNYSLIITLIGILLFAVVLMFPYQIGALFLQDSISASNYFEIDSQSSFNKNGDINLYLAPTTNLDLEISKNDPKNSVFVEGNICNIEGIENINPNSNSKNSNNLEFISLDKDSLYIFSYKCESNVLTENLLYGQISFNLFEKSIEDYIFIEKGTIQVSNSLWN